jgi:hypothetical protein
MTDVANDRKVPKIFRYMAEAPDNMDEIATTFAANYLFDMNLYTTIFSPSKEANRIVAKVLFLSKSGMPSKYTASFILKYSV